MNTSYSKVAGVLAVSRTCIDYRRWSSSIVQHHLLSCLLRHATDVTLICHQLPPPQQQQQLISTHLSSVSLWLSVIAIARSSKSYENLMKAAALPATPPPSQLYTVNCMRTKLTWPLCASEITCLVVRYTVQHE